MEFSLLDTSIVNYKTAEVVGSGNKNESVYRARVNLRVDVIRSLTKGKVDTLSKQKLKKRETHVLKRGQHSWLMAKYEARRHQKRTTTTKRYRD